jgi:predicted esterase
VTRSALSFRTLPADERSGHGDVVVLQRYGGTPEELVPLARVLAPGAQVVLPEAPRGLYTGRALLSTYWYVATDHTRPDGPSFGDVLYHVEQFLLDAHERRGEGAGEILLVGDEQGAVLALAMALVRPELLSGVVALRGCLPVVDGWEPPRLPLDGLPVLLASDPDDPAVPEDRLAATEEALAAADARVSRVTAPLGTPSAEGRILRAWSETER